MLNDQATYFGKDLEAMVDAVNYQQWLVDEFKPYLGSRIAEIGAGNGNISNLILLQNIEKLYAFEPSENMYRLLKKRMNCNAKVEIFQTIFQQKAEAFANFFDTILYVNVLEHIEDDRQELFTAQSCLKSKGYIGIFVPAMKWLYSNYDKSLGHFRRYSKSRLVELVNEADFDVVKVRYFDIAGILPWYVNFVLLKKQLTYLNVQLYDNVVIPIMRYVEGIVQPPIGKSLFLIGQKR